MEDIYINSYISFSPEYGEFLLSVKAQEILYRQKHVICSYSGCVDWGHHFFCELLDLYSGSSPYNYALGTVDYYEELKIAYQNGHQKEVTDWVERNKTKDWFRKAATMLSTIIEDVGEYDD